MNSWSNAEDTIGEIFNNIKSVIINYGTKFYEDLVNLIGEVPAKMSLIVLAIVIILFTVLKIINR